MTGRLTVCCFWWQDPLQTNGEHYRFTERHVTTLRSMVARHLSVPHDFVCVTDQVERIDGVRVVPIDRATFVPGTRYAKLMLFRRDIGDVIGKRILYLDLDCVIVGSIDPHVSRPEPLVVWRDIDATRRTAINTSMLLLDAGARPEVYESFDRRRHPAMMAVRDNNVGTDQAWLSFCVGEDYPACWTRHDGVWHAKRISGSKLGPVRRRKNPRAVAGPTKLPTDARVVFFPGARDPSMQAVRKVHPWIEGHWR